MPTEKHDLCVQALIILLLPLAAFVVQIFFSKKIPPRSRQGDWLPTLAMLIACVIATKMFFIDLIGNAGGIVAQKWFPFQAAGNGPTDPWISIPGAAADAVEGAGAGMFRVDFGIMVDNLTIVMLFVVTLVSFLVHLYSIGYMQGEVRYGRFFAYLALFSFSMLGLCITSNLLFLFIFWELVGLCSYFLIGFYFEKKSASNAAIKAFITTRIGDLGFLAAILIIATTAGTLEFDGIFESVAAGKWAIAGIAVSLATTGICLFIGPIGKSAQFPMHVWLPDAMEGPTPVSALIHAATMVVAGVYLMGRMFPFMAGAGYFEGNYFDSDPLYLVALVGGFTAIFAASIAFVQTDIKKVLAYSTVSQLGYMFLGIGTGAMWAGMFHLMTHAMFKACLFLGSGSVIHAVHSNEMSDMGGLSNKMKITWATFLISTLAIAGLPLLSGFYSKEAILTQAMAYGSHHGGLGAWLPFIFGIITALMTAFYMFRMFFLTFHGEPKNKKAYDHAHESPWTMTVPLIVLAVLAVGIGGFMFNGSHNWFRDRVNSETLYSYNQTEGLALVATGEAQHYIPGDPETAAQPVIAMAEAVHHAHWPVMGMSIASFLIGVFGAWFLFAGPKPRADTLLAPTAGLGKALSPLQTACTRLWYLDEIFLKFVIGIRNVGSAICGTFDKVFVDGFVNLWSLVVRLLGFLVSSFDHGVVDGSVRGIGFLTLAGGRWMKRIQTGRLQDYLYVSVFLTTGVLVVALVLFKLWF
jgi:NADH-quinone oxidoreductase subunit L